MCGRWWRGPHFMFIFGQAHVPLCRWKSEACRDSAIRPGHVVRSGRECVSATHQHPTKLALCPPECPGANGAPHALLMEAGQGSSPEGGKDKRTWRPFRALQDQLLPGPTA